MTYRVGIVGSGFGGAVHAPAYTLHEQFDVLAIASPNRAEAVAAERTIPHAFPSLEAMLDAIGDRLDVISVASPPAEHHADVMRALAANKHVLCEKPFATRLADAEAMLAAARQAGVAHALAFEFRYGSAIQALKELIVNGHLPALREIEVTRFGSELRAERARPRSSWWYDAAAGGGITNAFMPHLADAALFLAGGPPRSAHGFMRTANRERSDPDGSTYPVTASDGCFAVVDAGAGLALRITLDGTLTIDHSTIALHGETRSAIASGPHLLDMTLFVMEPGSETDEFELAEPKHAKYRSVHPNLPYFLALLDDFAERIATGGGNAPSFADGVAAQRILSACGYELP